MNSLLLTAIICMINQNIVLFDFRPDAAIQEWKTVDDVVMGGKSNSKFSLNSAGHGVFEGTVSLENNGGFASVRYGFIPKEIRGFKKAVIRLKGDGKYYQFRIRKNPNDYFAYVREFQSSTEWQNVEIPLNEMEPKFRGVHLDLPNFNGDVLSEIAFLISNKKNEQFRLTIDRIILE